MNIIMKSSKLFLLFLVLLVACTDTAIEPRETNGIDNTRHREKTEAMVLMAESFKENYELGNKPAYAAANVTLTSGSWYFSDALLGSTSADRKTGIQSARLRNTGAIRMNFNLTTGASAINIQHAVYGSDGSSTWELWMSSNGGSTYTKVGSTITSSSTSLSMASFTVSMQGNVRFEIRKKSGGGNRINIDNVEVIPQGTATSPDNDNLAFGNPSQATASITNANNYLMSKASYTMSYNRSRATANWVSWYVGPSTLGNTPRQNDFRADTSLPSGWYQVQATSYSGSGFDRGHSCPSADRTASVTANSSTFLMTNVIPQAPNNDHNAWNNLEMYTRTLVNSGYEAYVIMGCYGIGGTGNNGFANTIDNGKITVPNRIWKVIVILPQGENDLTRVTNSTRVIAIDTPNSNSINSSWGQYRTTVNAIEAATGYDILSMLPDTIESILESSVDTGSTN
jgi:endonuclease G